MAQRQQGKKKKENKEDGPEAVSEDEKKKERNEGERDLQKTEDLCGPCVTANQLQLAVMMALLARSQAQGQNEQPFRPDEGPFKIVI